MKRIGTSYKQTKPENNYDAIVVGSGIGGMATAVFLAKAGKKVLVLERHYTAGGFTHVFKRRDYEWDVGIHYIGEVMNERSAMYALFHYITDGELKWADMGDVYDRIVFGDKIYDFVKGRENWRVKMKEYFPEPKDQESIDKYIELILAAAGSVKGYSVAKALPSAISWAARPFMQRDFLKHAKKTTRETLEEITDNEQLIGVLTGQYGDYGLPPGQSSFVIHAMVVKHYFRGGAYPIGGSSEIAAGVETLLNKHNSHMYTNAPVAEILVKNNKAYGVKMEDGDEYTADMIISNAGINVTFNHLLKSANGKAEPYKRILKEVKPSAAHVSLYIGLKHTAEELNLPKANYWIYPENYNHDENLANYFADPENAPLPVAYISFPGAKDPDFTNRYPGRCTIEIISLAPFEDFEKWDGSRWKHRGEDYDAMKERISQRLLEQLYKYEPQLKGKIDTYELSTPLTTKHFVNYQQGEIYGIDHTPQRFKEKLLQPRTPIKNLYLTGQDILTAGVGGALFAGVLTASAILGKNLTSDVMEYMKEKS